MDTNSNIPVLKRIMDIEILNLKAPGYGPQGKHTREEWRQECYAYFEKGKTAFENWQNSWEKIIDENIPAVSFAATIKYDDGSSERVLEGMFFNASSSYCLDFVGQFFPTLTTAEKFNFLHGAFFNGATFLRVMNFRDAIFSKWADFSFAAFDGYVDFKRANFLGFTKFGNANFGDVDFRNAKFKSYADFENTIFTGRADFSEQLEFQYEANFKRAFFSKDANFSNTIFSNITNFSSAIFKRDADFRNTTFENKVNFFKSKFLSQCRFDYDPDRVPRTGELTKEVKFFDEVNFENVDIQNVGHFEKAYFVKRIPNFLGVDNAKTLLIFSGDECFNKKDTSGNATDRIAQLKRLSEEQGQTDQMLMFNAFELNAKARQPNAGILFKYFTWLYEKTSNYGRSFAKPIFWYGVLICLSALFAMFYSTYSDSPAAEQQVLCKPIKDQPPPLKLRYERAVAEYAMFRAGGLMDFTDTGKQNNAVNCRLFEEPIEPPLMRAWGIFKGIASIALLFLAALGLRNKYRIK